MTAAAGDKAGRRGDSPASCDRRDRDSRRSAGGADGAGGGDTTAASSSGAAGGGSITVTEAGARGDGAGVSVSPSNAEATIIRTIRKTAIRGMATAAAMMMLIAQWLPRPALSTPSNLRNSSAAPNMRSPKRHGRPDSTS